ncbi:MAG: ATP phosphoribosyltransferase regulatory subunit, partial [Gammaproteobacteria bacterium]|nr:ATP phosphoribosyltransferase regulatory subunit [Gammaproteobacteria bacterium]
ISGAIFAPADEDADLHVMVKALREQGERVVHALPGQAGDAATMGCDRVLAKDKHGWVIRQA